MEEIKKISSTLYLKILFFKEETPTFQKIVVDGEEQKLEEEIKVEIKFNETESIIGIKVVKLSLFFDNEEYKHYFELMKETTNYGFLFFQYDGKTLDILFNDKEYFEPRIYSSRTKKYLDINVNNNRLLLINFGADYKLYNNNKNNENINKNIAKTFLDLPKIDSSSNSLQINVVNLDEEKIFHKMIEEPEEYNFSKIYDKNMKNAKDFFESIKSQLDENSEKDFNYKEFSEVLDKGKNLIDGYNIKLNLTREILIKNYNKKEYFDFISFCSLYYVLSSFDNKKDKYFNDNEKKQMKFTFKIFMNYKNKLENDADLKDYLRILIIIDFARQMEKIINKNLNISEIENMNYQYYIKNEEKLEKNSPLNIALTNLINFIEDLNEKSPFYDPLILIDSGCYIYKTHYKAYGHGIISCELLKNHLKNIVPEVIITFSEENIYKDDQALSDKKIGLISLNLSSKLLLPLKDIDISKNIEDKDLLNNLSLRIYLVLFHEVFGHKKAGFGLIDEEKLLSPNYFYDKNKKRILKLAHINSTNPSLDVVKILRDPNYNSDSGSFLEYFFGECEFGYISELMEIMILNDVNLNFILDSKLWNDDINTLRKYIQLKFLIYYNNKQLFEKKEFKSINEEIYCLEDVIKKNNLKSEYSVAIDKNKNNEFIDEIYIRKRKELVKSAYKDKINYQDYAQYSFAEIIKKYKEDETSGEQRIIYKDILLHRFLRK